MTDLVNVDQTPAQHYPLLDQDERFSRVLLRDSAATGERCSGHWLGDQSFQANPNFHQRKMAPGKYPAARDVSSLAFELAKGREALADIERTQRYAARDEKHRSALRWLADNRHRFSGQWIALQGGHLLANGATAREVYAQVINECPPALVVKIEDDDLPFGGW